MKALSLRQPWADCVLFLGKSWENRKRPTQHRGPLVIHLAKGWDKKGEDFLWENWELGFIQKRKPPVLQEFIARAQDRRGGLGGIVEILDCQPLDMFNQADPWAFGPFCYQIGKKVRVFKKIIPARGQLGFWNIPEENLLEKVMKEAR